MPRTVSVRRSAQGTTHSSVHVDPGTARRPELGHAIESLLFVLISLLKLVGRDEHLPFFSFEEANTPRPDMGES